MLKSELLKDTAFEAITEARVDAKHRVALGRLTGDRVTGFRVYRNAHGQFILDPLVTIPAHEAWLFSNQRAARLVQRGLADAKRGRVVKAKEDFSRYAAGAA